MEELAKNQEAVGKEIQRIITNYKKDSADRKNQVYYAERLKKLQDLWSQFEDNDNQIRCLPQPPLEHKYFKSEYYQGIEAIYEQYKEHFRERIAHFTEAIESSTASKITIKQQIITAPASQNNNAESKNIPSNEETDVSQDIITRLIRRQNGIIESLRGLFMTVKIDEHQPRSYYELKIGTINKYWTQIENLNYSILEIDDDPSSAGYDADAYILLEAKVNEELDSLTRKLNNLAEPIREVTNSIGPVLNLPKIIIPKFDGEYLKWRQFHDLFSEMVHKQSMADCQKMWYLKTNLVGEAERLIRHLSLSDENYAAAWKILNDRYNNPRLLVSAFVNRIMSQPSHTTETASASAIKSLHDTTQECLRGLESLGVSVDNWDPLLLHILLKKVDKATHTLYEQSLADPKKLQTIADFLAFLENRFQSLEALGSKGKKLEEAQKKQGTSNSCTSITTRANKCVTCNNDHQLFACKEFLQLSPLARRGILKRHSLCFNCMKGGHNITNCSSRNCTKCNKKHNTLIHMNFSQDKKENPHRVVQGSSEKSSNVTEDNHKGEQSLTLATNNKHQEGYVFLSTAIVELVNNKGDSINVRAILDSGSQVTLITEKAIRKLGLSPIHKPMTVQGIGSTHKQARLRANMLLKSKINEYSTRIEAVILPHIIPPQPTEAINTSKWPIPKNIKLADPRFNKPGQIDLLIGAEFCHQLLAIGQIKLGDELPILQNTLLGWIVTGKVSGNPVCAATCGVYTTEESLERKIEKFWKIEGGFEDQPKLTLAEKRCEAYFNQTVSTGRFIVSLPFSDDTTKLGESRDVALKRFYALERKLAKDAAMKQQYIDFMKEYKYINDASVAQW